MIFEVPTTDLLVVFVVLFLSVVDTQKLAALLQVRTAAPIGTHPIACQVLENGSWVGAIGRRWLYEHAKPVRRELGQPLFEIP